MGHAAGQPSYGLDFLGLTQLVLKLAFFLFLLFFAGDIDHDPAPPSRPVMFSHHGDEILDP